MIQQLQRFLERTFHIKKHRTTILGGYASHTPLHLVLWLVLGLLVIAVLFGLLWLLLGAILGTFAPWLVS